jgi:hypothetical protein
MSSNGDSIAWKLLIGFDSLCSKVVLNSTARRHRLQFSGGNIDQAS